ncbi:MAG: DUF5715 family protein, partial [Gemmatimonadota bacterium]
SSTGSIEVVDRMSAVPPRRAAAAASVATPLLAVLLLAVLLLAAPAALAAQSLRGSSASLIRQNEMARRHDFSYLETAADVERFVRLGLLVPIEAGEDLEIDEASFAFGRPEVRSFLVRLARRYREACGRTLVVTSVTRPERGQPSNASSRSVHPTGMAVDVRRTNDMPCRGWLEATLLHLEDEGVVEATRESYPPHYHIAVFSSPYRDYIAAGGTIDPTGGAGRFHVVRTGETLSGLADRYGTSVVRLRRENGLRTSRIYVGQVLRIPRRGG